MDVLLEKQAQSGKNSCYLFDVFSILWVTGILMEMVEAWRYPLATAGFFALSIVVVLAKQKRIPFLVFLLVTTAYFVVARFPEVANHINLVIFCNVLLILGLLYSYVSRLGRTSFPDYFKTLLSPLRLMLVATYFIAGFHKLNTDFLSPDVSCIRYFMDSFQITLLRPLFATDAGFQVPVYIVLAIFAAIVLFFALKNSKRSMAMVAVVLSILGVCLISGIIIWNARSAQAAIITAGHVDYAIIALAGLIVFWQLIEGPLLLIPRLQIVILCFAMLVHTYLSMIGFVDFQSIALALIMTFVPEDVFNAWYSERRLHFAGIRMDRINAYFLLNAFAGITTYIHISVIPIFHLQTGVNIMQGIFFNMGVVILLWPIIRSLVSGGRRWRWLGVKVIDVRAPGFLFLIPVLLLAYGMTSYLGLRTAGNFSMFSNLRTEGESSNHILFATNPIKLWGYQEDTVFINKLDDEAMKVGHHYKKLQGYKLPVVEFRKQIDTWTRANMSVPITFTYNNKLFKLQDITTDSQWRSRGWDWEMRLLDFRVIQSDGGNLCRW